MNTTTVTTPNELEIRVERVFDAPRAHVFSVWTDPQLIPEWWGDGTVVEEMDVRPGGTYRFRTNFGLVQGEFHEVDPPERLVQTFQNHLQTLEFEDLGDRTKLTQTMRFATTEERDTTMQYGVEEGAKSGFARVDAVLQEWQRRITAGRKPTVYAHVAVEDGKLALQYWFFYVYNDFNNKHEGDWELIQLDFDAATPTAALRMHPFEVGYSQHDGAERAEWGAAKLELEDGTHPVVYPAEGSHANYFSGALFLGRSAAEGIGCDNTNEPWRQPTPAVDVIPPSPQAASAAFPWLDYRGRWGERRSGFYNAPTGPSTRLQWTQPITWANDTWRSRSFALAGGRSLGPTATSFFCGVIGAVSTGLIFVSNRPTASVAVVVVLLFLLILAASRTRWALKGPDALRAERPWGSLVTSAARTYMANARLFLGIGAIFLVFGLVTGVLQFLVFRLSGLSSLVDAFGASNAFTETVVLAFGFVVNLIGLTIVQATCARAMVELSTHGRATATAAYRETARRAGPLLSGLVLAALAVAFASVTLFGLPLAIWLTVRWSLLAQAVALDDASGTGSLRRSGLLVRGEWWRAASLTVFVTGIALLLGPLVGTLLLFATNASFDIVNVASDVVYVVALPFAAIATTYLYFDLAAKSAARAATST